MSLHFLKNILLRVLHTAIPPLSIKGILGSFYIISALLLLNIVNLKAQKRIPYEFKQFTISDGLPDNTVYGCFQDSENYMWFFTPSGASRFNGRVFENYTINNNLADNEVLNGFEDSQKRLWFYSFNGKIAYFNLKTNKIQSYRDNYQLWQLSLNKRTVIKSIIEDTKHNIWINDETIIDIIRNDNCSIKSLFLNLDLGNPQLYINKQNKISFSNSKTTTIINDANYNVEELTNLQNERKISTAKNGIFFFNSSKGIFKWDGVKLECVLLSSAYKNTELISLNVDDDNTLWLGTPNGMYGFDLINKQLTNFFYTGIPVSKVLKDKEGNYWITTMGKGVILLTNNFNKITLKNKFYGLLENEITCLEKNTLNNNILFAARPNLIYTQTQNNELLCSKINNNEQLKITKLKSVGNDLWFIVKNSQTHIVPNFFKKYPTQINLLKYSDLNPSMVKSTSTKDIVPYLSHISTNKNIFITRNNTLYVSYWSLLKVKYDSKFNFEYMEAFYIPSIDNSNAGGRIYAMAQDENNCIWIGGTNGIGHNDVNDENKFRYLYNLRFESTINDMCALANNTLLISTTGSGIYLVKNKEIVAHYLEKDGLSSNNCNHLYKQDDKKVWIATAKGATLISYQDSLYSKPDFTIFGGKNNNPATYVNDILINNDTIYLATNDGLYSFDINKVTPQSNKPILKLLIPNQLNESPDKVFKLKRSFFENDNQINFQFESIAFLNGDIMTYQYQLFRNNTLVESDTVTQKDKFILPFYSLNSGKYRLEVICKRSDNIESDKIISQFEVSPPIYLSVWALFLYILVGGWFVFRFLQRLNQRSRERKEYLLQQQSEKVKLEGVALAARQRLLELEQESLRARVDPHFIFNCLNGLMLFVYEKDFISIKKLLPRLARLIRNSLQLGNKDFISIESEKAYLEDYLSLEKMRFEDKFDYDIIIDDNVDVLKALIPPLMIQIFVENAIRHGFKNLPKTKVGNIKIRFQENNDALMCIVEDNGIGITHSMNEVKNKEHVSFGLNIVKKRISVLNEIHGLRYELSFKDKNSAHNSETGTIVKLTIPLNE